MAVRVPIGFGNVGATAQPLVTLSLARCKRNFTCLKMFTKRLYLRVFRYMKVQVLPAQAKALFRHSIMFVSGPMRHWKTQII